MNVANVATLDIPVAMLIPLEQAFNHVSRFNILLYFLYFLLNIFSLFINPRLLDWTMFRWYATCGGASTERGPGPQEELMEEVDMYYSSPFLINE